jgi:TIR domain
VNLFVSFSHEDHEAVFSLTKPLTKMGHYLWLDEELHIRGGVEWWKEILEQIKQQDAVLLALTENWLESDICVAEFEWAYRLHRHILPLQLADLDPNVLPEELQLLQIVDYTQPRELAVADLLATINGLGSAPGLPDPLPEPPQMPTTQIFKYRKRIESSDFIDPDGQRDILRALSSWLAKPKLKSQALELLCEFAERDDITVVNHRRAEELLSSNGLSAGTTGQGEKLDESGAGPPPQDPLKPDEQKKSTSDGQKSTSSDEQKLTSSGEQKSTSSVRWRPKLAMAIEAPDWSGRASCEAQIRVRSRVPGKQDYAEIFVQPAIPGQRSVDYASNFTQHHPLPPNEQAVSGFLPSLTPPTAVERSVVKQKPSGPLRLFQRIWVDSTQGVAIKATEGLRPMVDGMEIAVGQLMSDPVKLDGSRYFSPSIVLNDMSELVVSERLTLVRLDTRERVTADHEKLDEGADPDSWFDWKVERFLSQLAEGDPSIVSTDKGKIFGLPATVVTVRSRQSLANGTTRHILTKMAFACADSDSYQVTISLGQNEQSRFTGLVRHTRLMA